MSRQASNGYLRGASNGSANPSAANSQQRLVTPTTQTQRSVSPGSASVATSAMSRAERFEDEKRRVIESCFSKLDATNQLAESYITHIRITEDSAYPSTPPPPESAETNKKPRLIIIAVRSTGRVRMHKARENNNGSFSIGKTWNLEEMSAIETFSSNVAAQTEKEAQQRLWAGAVGFTVTITKPYYWQAGTSKEKDFFIASAVKIYRKYTKGLMPELRGFDEREKATLLGAVPGQVAAAPPQQAQERSPAGVSPGMRAESRTGSREVSDIAPPQPPFAQRPQSREESRYRGSPGPPASIHDAPRPGSAVSNQQQNRQQNESPAPSSRWAPPPEPAGRVGGAGVQGVQQQVPRPFASQEQMRSGSPARVRQDFHRPGTSPGPRPFEQARTPPPAQQQPVPMAPPSIPSARSESPGGSSLASSVGLGRPQVRTASPPREQRRGYQQRNVSDDQSIPSRSSQQTRGEREVPEALQAAPQQQQQQQTNGAQSGANLFAATRQRWMAGGQQQPNPQPSQRPQSPGAPQLPPISTSQPLESSQQNLSANPKTGASEASSAGFDFGDVAAIGAITSYWGPEPTPAVSTPPPPIIEEPASPLTPERSARRPQLHDRGISDHQSYDLRPPPLRSSGGQGRSFSADEGHGSQSAYATPLDRSAQATPRTEEPPEIKPLAVQKRQSVEQRPRSSRAQDETPKLAMPGGFASTPAGPSPMGTPATESAPTRQSSQQEARQAQIDDEAELAAARLQDEQDAERERLAAEAYRPGLGPMIKKTAVRDKFKKAAAAAVVANAFKPRPGGAAEKILRAKAEREGGVASPVGGAGGDAGVIDGVSGFVPRPAASRQDTGASVIVGGGEGNVEQAGVGEGARDVQPVEKVTAPKVEVSSPLSPGGEKPLDSPGIIGLGLSRGVELTDASPNEKPDMHLQTPEQAAQQEAAAEQALFEQREARKPQVKIRRRGAAQQRNIAALGIDPSLLENLALDFEATLTDFGWSTAPDGMDLKGISNLEADIRREQSRLEAGSWLSHTDTQRDDKVAAIDALFERAIAECDEMEGLLTLYSVELGSLNEDVAFIEAQSQGLQVQSANQKGLVRELEGLVETMSLDRRVLEPLRYGDLAGVDGLEQVEASLVRLWQAMGTIDPGFVSGRGRKRTSNGSEASEPLSSMKALREKKEVYEREVTVFVQRLMQQLDSSFAHAFGGAKGKVMRPAGGGAKRLNKDVFGELRRGLWVYGPLMLFVREMSAPAWGTVLRMYYQKAGPVYADAFWENLVGWKGAAKKAGAEEAELLFTTAEKDEGPATSGGVAAARKLTIKRSQTLAKTLRTASGGKSPTEGSRSQGQMMSSEVFGGAMDEMAPLIPQEQNFVVELFHATGQETQDFVEIVQATPPEQRRGPANLLKPKSVDADREVAKQVTSVMEQLFASFAQEMGALLEWSVAGDPIQGVGVMACLSRHAYYLQDSSQEFLLQLLEGLSSRLQNLWSKFVDEQVRAIEDTKVKVKKRKGVIGFMEVFPYFAAAVENVFSTVAREDYEREAASMFEVRRLVDETYARLNRAMFDSLKVIAKESPTVGTGQQRAGASAEDPEDKQMLNYHVLLIENMNHYVEEVEDGGKQGVLAEWRGKAMLERAEALDAYVKRVLARPLGKLLDFLDSAESLLASHPANPTAIASRPSYSRKTARNMFSQFDAKEVRRGIDTLRKRIEKHFGDADEEVLSRNLVGFVGKECERTYEKTIERMEKLVSQVWPPTEGEKDVLVDFSREDVRSGFKIMQR